MQELKPMDIGNIIDRTFKMIISGKSLGLTFISLAINSILVFLIGGMIVFFFRFDFSNLNFDINNSTLISRLPVFVPACIGILILMNLSAMLYAGMATDLYSSLYLNREWSLITSLKTALKKTGIFIRYYLLLIGFTFVLFLVYFSVSLLFGIMASSSQNFVFMIPLMIFAFFFYIAFFALYIFITLSIPSIVIENAGAMGSFLRSFRLVRYNFWRILGSNLLLNIIVSFLAYMFIFVIIIMAGIILLITKFDFTNSSSILSVFLICYMCLILIMVVIYQCMQNAFNVLIFYNQKIKNEGFGVEILAKSMIEETHHDEEKE